MSFRIVLFGAILLALGFGGTLVWKGWDAMSGLASTVQAKEKICATLDDAERMALIGVATPTKLAGVEGSLDQYSCRWATKDYQSLAAFVQAVSAPADVWAEQTRTSLVAPAPGQGTRRQRALLAAAGTGALTPDEGCRFARLLFEQSGARSSAKRTVAPVAGGVSGSPAVLAHSCVQGTYSAVLVVAPALEIDRQLARKAAKALRAVESRAD